MHFFMKNLFMLTSFTQFYVKVLSGILTLCQVSGGLLWFLFFQSCNLGFISMCQSLKIDQATSGAKCPKTPGSKRVTLTPNSLVQVMFWLYGGEESKL